MIILNLLLRYYKDQFARIWIFSPSIKLDPQYAPLRKHLEKMTDQQKEPLMFEDMDQAALGKVLDEQRKITEECRKRKVKAPQVCVILDDMADRGDILQRRQGGTSGGSWLVTLATRGRHFGVTWLISSLCLNVVGTVIRKNARRLCIWRLRNYKEIETLCEELSGVYDKNTILELYRHATEEPYSFLFVRLDAKTREDMFWLRFEKRLTPIKCRCRPPRRTTHGAILNRSSTSSPGSTGGCPTNCGSSASTRLTTLSSRRPSRLEGSMDSRSSSMK
jgi:hypothetical protein